jgi:hypothetical protein
MRNLHAETDLNRGLDGVTAIWDPVDRAEVSPISGQGRRALLIRHLKMLEHGPLHSHKRRGGCAGTVGFLQRHGTCWFNSILHALFMSDLGNKLMRGLYADWVLGVRAGKDARRGRLLQHFRSMLDLTAVDPELLLKMPVRPAAVIAQLHRYSASEFPNVGRNKGFMFDKYIKELLAFLGVPKQRIMFVNVPGGAACDRLDDHIAPLMGSRKSAPLIILVSQPPDAPNQGDGQACTPNKVTWTDHASGKTHTYVLDACMMATWGKGVGMGHAIAGITCGGKRFLLDSNVPRSSSPYDPVQHAHKRVVPYDWRTSSKQVATITMPDLMSWSGTRAKKLAVYYNREILDKVYGAGKHAAEVWLAHLDKYMAGAKDADLVRPPSAVRDELRFRMKDAFTANIR